MDLQSARKYRLAERPAMHLPHDLTFIQVELKSLLAAYYESTKTVLANGNAGCTAHLELLFDARLSVTICSV